MARHSMVLSGRDYSVTPGFGDAPPDIQFSRISDVATDSMDRVYVYQRGTPPVIVLDSDGKYLKSWGTEHIADAHGIFISPQDEVYAVDRDTHRVLKFDLDGNLLMSFKGGLAPYGDPFNHPTDAAVAPSGDVYVTDGYGNSRVHRFAASGELIESWGEAGSGPGQLSLPHGIWVDAEGLVYVADRENDRIQVFGASGEHRAEWTGFHRPTDMWMDPEHRIFVCDLGTRVHVLARNGSRIGGGRSDSQGHGIWGDSKGNLYIASPLKKLEKWTLDSNG